MNNKVKEWEEEFDKRFPYRGMILEDNGYHYTFFNIKNFIRSLKKQWIEELKEKIKPFAINKYREKYYTFTIKKKDWELLVG